MFFLSRIDVFIYESLEIKIYNTSKDEIIFIGNDITSVAFIITDKFWREDTWSKCPEDFCFTISIFPPKDISRS